MYFLVWGELSLLRFLFKKLQGIKNVTAALSNANRHREDDSHLLSVCTFLRVKNSRKGGFAIVLRRLG